MFVGDGLNVPTHGMRFFDPHDDKICQCPHPKKAIFVGHQSWPNGMDAWNVLLYTNLRPGRFMTKNGLDLNNLCS
jgi:hypothetical protein